MIAFEMMFLMILGVVAVVTVAAVGRPLAEAYAEQLKAQYRGLGGAEQASLTSRITSLEEELLDLRHKITQVQESTDFTIKLLESYKDATPQIQEHKES